MPTQPAQPAQPVHAPVVTVVQSPACHHCHEARQVLATLQTVVPMTVEVVDVTTREGMVLIQQHRPASYPLVLVDGELFSTGRLPATRLVQALEARTVAEVGA